MRASMILAEGRASCSREVEESSFQRPENSATLTLSAAMSAGASKELAQRAVMKLLADEVQADIVQLHLLRAHMQV